MNPWLYARMISFAFMRARAHQYIVSAYIQA